MHTQRGYIHKRRVYMHAQRGLCVGVITYVSIFPSCLFLVLPLMQIEEGVLVALKQEEVTYLDCEATIDELLQDEIIVHDA